MKYTNRDKVLLMLLPALLISTIYFGWMGYRKHGQLMDSRKKLDEVQRAAPADAQVRIQALQVAKLNKDIDRYQQDLAAAKSRWDDFIAKCTSPEHRNERIEKLTALLSRHSLTMVDDTEAEGNKVGNMPEVLKTLEKHVALASKTTKPHLRELHFHGGFTGVHGVLQELSNGEMFAIPVGLSVVPAKDNPDKREWTLLVWI